MNLGYPSAEAAERELRYAGESNPGPWIEHSIHTGLAAKYIAEKCVDMNPEKAYALGLLHDIGRRVGIVSQRHIIEGYRFCMEHGWEDAARICMTHSFMVQDIKADVGDWDVSEEDYAFMQHYIEKIEYDDYDKLFQLCDSLALADGFCLLEKRFVDVHRRYGVNEYTVPRWNAVFEIKEYFENRIGQSIYDLLPNVKETAFINVPLWKPPMK
ncbi:MAG TPA: HD domain-containing protein [Mobilitalea sp.]|nr:HD domain-containing protein [Mobilitalea sp.]